MSERHFDQHQAGLTGLAGESQLTALQCVFGLVCYCRGRATLAGFMFSVSRLCKTAWRSHTKPMCAGSGNVEARRTKQPKREGYTGWSVSLSNRHRMDFRDTAERPCGDAGRLFSRELRIPQTGLSLSRGHSVLVFLRNHNSCLGLGVLRRHGCWPKKRRKAS